MKVMIATPAYDGKVHIPYAVALSETVILLAVNKIESTLRINASGSLLLAERNRIVESFMESDCTHLLCIDGDLGWPAQAVIEMLKKDVEFIAGVYPARGDMTFTFRAKLNPDSSIVKNGTHLLGMEYIPAGFMLMKRSVIEKLREKFPELYYEPKAKELKQHKAWGFFMCEIWNGEFWGEDYVFCRKVREAGVDIWVDPLIEFDHAGTRGTLVQVLTNEPKEISTKP